MEVQKEIKPGMGGKTTAQTPPTGDAFPGAPPRGPQVRKAPPPPLGAFLGVKLTDDLRKALRQRALSEGLSDGAWVRRLMLDALAMDSDLDRASARVPPEEIQAAARMLDRLTSVVLASRTLQDGQAGGAIQALEMAHGRLVDIIGRMER